MLRTDIKAVFLDAGSTLFQRRQSRPETYLAVAKKHGLKELEFDAMKASMEHAFSDLPDTVDGNFRFSLAWFWAYNQRVLTECGMAENKLEKAHKSLLAQFADSSNYTLFPEVKEVLETLSNHGMQMGVVSNWTEHLPKLLQDLGIANYFSFIVTSADLRTEKPGRAIFERALFRAGVAAEETVHTGGHFERDVRGALNAGMRAVWLDRSGEYRTDCEGVPVVAELGGLVKLLEAQPNVVRN
ncbi:MAG: HAD-IA family hydrolase [Planctomycetota bacterium]|nr:HAD-IA family hydrolase [Planctomycetota bacterium]